MTIATHVNIQIKKIIIVVHIFDERKSFVLAHLISSKINAKKYMKDP